jgi:hypothetical protein
VWSGSQRKMKTWERVDEKREEKVFGKENNGL